jgi:hypothetical protein
MVVFDRQVDQLTELTKRIEQLKERQREYEMAELIGREETLEELQRRPFVVRRRAQRHQERPASSLSQRPERPWYLRPVDGGTA